MKIVAYYRVSTSRQQKSGLGLDAQREAVQAFAKANGGKIIAEYTETESGRLAGRPKLTEAIGHAKLAKARLVVAKLDRLARNVAFLSQLMQSGADFVACDNPHATPLTIHILAAVAEDEAKRISQRTQDALRAAKRKGVKLGSNRRGHWSGREDRRQLGQRRATKAASMARSERAIDAYAFLLPGIQEQREHGKTLKQIADRLTEQGHQTTAAKPFTPTMIHRLLART